MTDSHLSTLEESVRAIASFGVTLREAMERLARYNRAPSEAEAGISEQVRRHAPRQEPAPRAEDTVPR